MTDGLVESTYVDAFGTRASIAPVVRDAVLAAMGIEPGDAPAPDGHVAVVRPGARLPGPGQVTIEDGTVLGRLTTLPGDVPFGYHRLVRDDGTQTLLISGPGRCHLPPDVRAWGWAVQLSALRSDRSWGIGDLADLRRLAEWSADRDAGFVAVSPLTAPNPSHDPEPSPYYPSTRRFWNPLHLSIADVPGAAGIADLETRGRTLNDERHIDRARVQQVKLDALERIWQAGAAERPTFEAWRAEQGPALERWARFCVLSERFGAGWQRWPEPYRRPDQPTVEALAQGDADRVAFHAWIQWCLDRQLAAASGPVRRIADMPVGVDPGGFDAWDWQDHLAIGATVGAPPDQFNPDGQDWGLPPFIPHRLREAGYTPFVDTVRSQLRHAGGLRIDHVLGLFRLWWIPAGHGSDGGAYVRYPTDELLEIVALESHRAGAVVVGEDLGTVPPGVRASLRRRRVLSTRLVIFEDVPPARYPRGVFAGVTTHDLPTIAGALSGSDLDDQARSGVSPTPEGLEAIRRRLVRVSGVQPDAGPRAVADRVHARLAASPAAFVAATIEDALGVEERPNLPGTVAEQRSNWSMALPMPLDDIIEDPGVQATAEAMRRS